MTLFSNIVASINTVMEGLGVVVDITHKMFVTDGGLGNPTYTTVTRRGFIDRRQRKIVTFAGIEIVSSASALFIGNVPVNEHDQIFFPDGTGGEVVSVSSPVDASGRLITEAFL